MIASLILRLTTGLPTLCECKSYISIPENSLQLISSKLLEDTAVEVVLLVLLSRTEYLKKNKQMK